MTILAVFISNPDCTFVFNHKDIEENISIAVDNEESVVLSIVKHTSK
ncbi:hypothetical protein ACIGHG_01605 [Bacillus sp. NPDC077411]